MMFWPKVTQTLWTSVASLSFDNLGFPLATLPCDLETITVGPGSTVDAVAVGNTGARTGVYTTELVGGVWPQETDVKTY